MFSLSFTTGATTTPPYAVDAADLLKAWIFSLLYKNPLNTALAPLLEILQNNNVCLSGTHLHLNPTQSSSPAHQVVPVAIYARSTSTTYCYRTRPNLAVPTAITQAPPFEYAIAFLLPGSSDSIQWFQSWLPNPGLPLLTLTTATSSSLPLPSALSFLAPVICLPGTPLSFLVHGTQEPTEYLTYNDYIPNITLATMGFSMPYSEDIQVTTHLSTNKDYSGFIFNCTLTADSCASRPFLTFQFEEHLATTALLAPLFLRHLECFIAACRQNEHLRSLLKPLLGDLVAYTDTSGPSTQQSWKTLDDYYHFRWKLVDSSSPQYQLQVFSVATNQTPLHLLSVDPKKAVDTTVLDGLATDIILETQLRPSTC